MQKTKTHQTKIGRWRVNYTNHPELIILKKEVFNNEIYHFKTTNAKPRILDVGAHIGLATLYFKSLYPDAQITCFEPILENFQFLEENIYANALHDVETIAKAIDAKNRHITLFLDPSKEHWFSTASIRAQAWNNRQITRPITVPACTLLPWLEQPIDLLKMDIEGAEWQVITSIKAKLTQIEQLIIECHPDRHHRVESLRKLLEQNNFQVQLEAYDDGLQFLRAKQKLLAS